MKHFAYDYPDYSLTVSPDINRLKTDRRFLLEYFFEAVFDTDGLTSFIDHALDLSNIEQYVKDLNYDLTKLVNYWKKLSSKVPGLHSNNQGVFFYLSAIPFNSYRKYTDISDCLIYLYFYNSATNYPAIFNSEKMEIHIPINLNKLWVQNIYEENINNYMVHELSHYFNYIRSKGRSIQGRDKIVKADTSNKLKILKLNVTKDEIDSRINEINRVKSKIDSGSWDKLSFMDIISSVQTIVAVIQIAYIGYYSESRQAQLEIDQTIHTFLTNIYKRMARENLIGSSMKWNGNLDTLKQQFLKTYGN